MDSFMKYIARIGRCNNCYRDHVLEGTGLTGAQCPYLLRICRHPGISQDQLAKRICINKSNVTRQAAVLEEEGFITRVPSSADKRVTELYPTQKALDLLPQISCILKHWELEITGDLTEAELEQLSALLAKMKTHATAYMEGR